MTKPLTASRATGALAKATVAAGLAVGLLAGGGGTLANWYDTKTVISPTTITAGHLGLTPGPLSVTVAHTDYVPGATRTSETQRTTTDITGQASTYPLVPGDQVTVSVPVTIQAVGTNLRATLTANPAALAGDAALVNEVTANGTALTLTPTAGAPALTSTGTNRWAVTPAHDGATYVMSVRYTTRATLDGAPRTETSPNWWRGTLQGASLAPRDLPLTIVQS